MSKIDDIANKTFTVDKNGNITNIDAVVIKKNKELSPLEAFEELKRQIGNIQFCRFDLNDGIPQLTTQLVRETGLFEIIETALKEYEGAKNHIKALNEERVENSLKLKALEIIKNTRVDTNIIKESKNYDDYCGLEAQKMLALMFSAPKQIGITEEEYDLLKEILK